MPESPDFNPADSEEFWFERWGEFGAEYLGDDFDYDRFEELFFAASNADWSHEEFGPFREFLEYIGWWDAYELDDSGYFEQ